MTEGSPALKDRPFNRGPDGAPRPTGSRRTLARVAWIIAAGLMLGMFVVAVPARFNQLLTITPLGDNALTILSTSEASALQQRGIPIELHALYFILLEIAFAAVYAVFGLTLCLRKSDEPVGMLASLGLIAVGVLMPGTLRVLDTPTSGLEFLILLNVVNETMQPASVSLPMLKLPIEERAR